MYKVRIICAWACPDFICETKEQLKAERKIAKENGYRITARKIK